MQRGREIVVEMRQQPLATYQQIDLDAEARQMEACSTAI